MGTNSLRYTLGSFCTDNARTLIGSRPVTSDVFTTSTGATFVEDGSGDITARAGLVFRAVMDEDAWIAFGGRTATVGNDFLMRANVEYEWQIDPDDAGKISIIDIA